ncbi:MAG: sugar phosphate isomerase/epimerase [Anaerolineae bacterium]|nr:sugar phosphate isomerase/epimerase [Anaerolineae bacterium]
MPTISFMSANFVARQVGYHMTEGWMQGDNATNDYFRPLATYAARFEALLLEVKAMGFTALDVWLGHLNPAWATPDHIAIARDLLARHGLTVVSLAGYFGTTAAEVEASCRLAQALGTTILGGNTALHVQDRPRLVSLLQHYGLKFGIENHPEKTPADMLAQIGDGGGGTIGTAMDTGWYGTQGYDAAQAVRDLGPEVLFHVHLKDVRAAGAHETCRLGTGVVPVAQCVQALRQMGYAGAYSIEHEPELFDPTEDVIASLTLLKGWLS